MCDLKMRWVCSWALLLMVLDQAVAARTKHTVRALMSCELDILSFASCSSPPKITMNVPAHHLNYCKKHVLIIWSFACMLFYAWNIITLKKMHLSHKGLLKKRNGDA